MEIFKTVKFNITETVEEMIIAQISGDEEELDSLKKYFEIFFNKQTLKLKTHVLKFIFNKTKIKDYKDLNDYFINFIS